jgi:hypothetical protein
MQLFLYTINDPENVVNKVLPVPYEMNIRLKSDTDLTNPSILLSSVLGVNYLDFNYCYIPQLERYYFIQSIDSVNAKIWRLTCECDVLMTYKADILASNARLRRNIKNGDYFNASIDSSILKTVSLHNSNVTIGDDHSLILTTVGV